MSELDYVLDLFFDQARKLFFPENWLNLDLKFSKSEIFSLLLIDKRKEITMTDLAEYLNSPMSTANGIVNRLVNKDYVVRERSEADRRIVVLRLTETGSEFICGVKEFISGYLKIIIDDLTAEEKDFLMKIVFRVINNLKNHFDDHSAPIEDNQIKNIEIE